MKNSTLFADLGQRDAPCQRSFPNNVVPLSSWENWAANLCLRFEKQGTRTVLAEQRHSGPLMIQKALYPEGAPVCHAVVIHPPGGIAEGDGLSLNFEHGQGTHVVITTPAATKWYKAPSRPAQQHVSIRLGAGAKLDWLPQENILFNQSRVETSFRLLTTLESTAI